MGPHTFAYFVYKGIQPWVVIESSVVVVVVVGWDVFLPEEEMHKLQILEDQ